MTTTTNNTDTMAMVENAMMAAHKGRDRIQSPRHTGRYGYCTVDENGQHPTYWECVNEAHARAIAALIPGAYPVAIMWHGQKRRAERI